LRPFLIFSALATGIDDAVAMKERVMSRFVIVLNTFWVHDTFSHTS